MKHPALEIKPCIGLSSLPFGSSANDALACFGQADEKGLLDEEDEDCQATVWHYWDRGFTLFFDLHDAGVFSCAEIDHPEAILWGQKIFTLTEKEIIALFKAQGYTQFETEQHEWGERRLSFDDCNIDFYFEKNKLASVNFGQHTINPDMIILPN